MVIGSQVYLAGEQHHVRLFPSQSVASVLAESTVVCDLPLNHLQIQIAQKFWKLRDKFKGKMLM